MNFLIHFIKSKMIFYNIKIFYIISTKHSTKGGSTMNRNEMWESISEEKMKLAVAGFKSHLTRNLKKAHTSRKKAEIKNYWETKIAKYLEDTRLHNESVKRHNASVKANATRKAKKSCKSTCKRSVRTVAR